MMGFNNIIGHEEVIRHLKNAIETGKVSHSYIFTGEPGSGKKLLAGTFAATLQCEEQGTEPCQKCDSCKKAMGKNHPDIIMVNHDVEARNHPGESLSSCSWVMVAASVWSLRATNVR